MYSWQNQKNQLNMWIARRARYLKEFQFSLRIVDFLFNSREYLFFADSLKDLRNFTSDFTKRENIYHTIIHPGK